MADCQCLLKLFERQLPCRNGPKKSFLARCNELLHIDVLQRERYPDPKHTEGFDNPDTKVAGNRNRPLDIARETAGFEIADTVADFDRSFDKQYQAETR